MVQEDISEASVVFGVKQVPIDSLQSNKTFCFFSHTIKAQSDNMELLDACLEKNVRLVDYEVTITQSCIDCLSPASSRNLSNNHFSCYSGCATSRARGWSPSESSLASQA